LADLHILRHHTLGLPRARKIAFQWAEHAEQQFGMSCTYQEGKSQDEVCFLRAGVQGTLTVTQNKFELDAKLGFLVGAFKARIESEIVKNLDDLLQPKPALKSQTSAKNS
jgi:putative polyhydroxyalkanoate system protein